MEATSTFKERMEHHANSPKATSAQISDGELQLTLETGAKVSLPARMLRPLAQLSDEQIAKVQLTAGGRGLLWHDGGASIAVEGLLEAATGLKSLQASAAKGGRAKTAAVRANGAKGGRPRKVAAT